MKKIFTFCLFMIAAYTASSQDLVLYHGDRMLENNEEITINEIDPLFGLMKAEIGVQNTGNASIPVKVRRTEVSLVEGSINYFCWKQCYTPEVSESPNTIYIMPDQLSNDFYAEYEPSETKGTSIIKYEFFDDFDEENVVAVVVRYSDKGAGIEDPTSVGEVTISSSSQGSITVSSQLIQEQELVIYNTFGHLIGKMVLPSGNYSSLLPFYLNKGIYIYALISGDKAVSSKKFIVY